MSISGNDVRGAANLCYALPRSCQKHIERHLAVFCTVIYTVDDVLVYITDHGLLLFAFLRLLITIAIALGIVVAGLVMAVIVVIAVILLFAEG